MIKPVIQHLVLLIRNVILYFAHSMLVVHTIISCIIVRRTRAYLTTKMFPSTKIKWDFVFVLHFLVPWAADVSINSRRFYTVFLMFELSCAGASFLNCNPFESTGSCLRSQYLWAIGCPDLWKSVAPILILWTRNVQTDPVVRYWIAPLNWTVYNIMGEPLFWLD